MTMLRDNERIRTLQGKVAQAREHLREALAETVHGDVRDYAFANVQGPVKLSALFGSKRDLIVMHNMGTGCNNCTMWADGFNGLYPHISDRAAFVVASPDTPAVQAAFAASRGWRFPMVSTGGTRFAADMGFEDDRGRPMPGVSAFQMQGGRIVRVSASTMEPYDDFCAVWHLFALFPEGANGWLAKKDYG